MIWSPSRRALAVAASGDWGRRTTFSLVRSDRGTAPRTPKSSCWTLILSTRKISGNFNNPEKRMILEIITLPIRNYFLERLSRNCKSGHFFNEKLPFLWFLKIEEKSKILLHSPVNLKYKNLRAIFFCTLNPIILVLSWLYFWILNYRGEIDIWKNAIFEISIFFPSSEENLTGSLYIYVKILFCVHFVWTILTA